VPIDSKGKNNFIFEGAMSEPQVYLNGKKWENGHMVIVIFILMFPNLYKKERTLSVKLSNKICFVGILVALYRKVSIIVK
jgi:beta-galactosidase